MLTYYPYPLNCHLQQQQMCLLSSSVAFSVPSRHSITISTSEQQMDS